jgi:hypothetical protein
VATIALAFLAYDEVPLFSEGPDPGDVAAWQWQLVVVAAAFGLIAYASADEANGTAYLGGAALLAFALTAVGDAHGSLLGWPLALVLMSLLGLALGLRPRRELPPPPDADAAAAEPVPLPGPQRASSD